MVFAPTVPTSHEPGVPDLVQLLLDSMHFLLLANQCGAAPITARAHLEVDQR